MRTPILLTLSAVLALSACSSEDEARPLELPEKPPGVQPLDDAGLEAQLDTVQQAVREVTGTQVAAEVIFDVTEGGAQDLIDYYDEALTADGWEASSDPGDIADSLGASWRRDGLSVVLVTVADVEGRDLAILIPPAGEGS